MSELSCAVSRFMAWWVNSLDNLLIQHWPAYCIRRYWQDWDNYRITGAHVWNKNLLEVLNVQYGYDKATFHHR